LSDYFSAAACAYGDHCPTIVMLSNSQSVGFSEGSTLPNQEPFTSHDAYLLEPMEDGLAGVAPSVGLVGTRILE